MLYEHPSTTISYGKEGDVCSILLCQPGGADGFTDSAVEYGKIDLFLRHTAFGLSVRFSE